MEVEYITSKILIGNYGILIPEIVIKMSNETLFRFRCLKYKALIDRLYELDILKIVRTLERWIWIDANKNLDNFAKSYPYSYPFWNPQIPGYRPVGIDIDHRMRVDIFGESSPELKALRHFSVEYMFLQRFN